MSIEQVGAGSASARMALMELAISAMVGQAIHVAARLGIADLLAGGPKTPAALAAATGTHADTLHRLLRALASRGVVAEDAEGRFALTPVAEGLRSAVSGSLRAYAAMLGEDWIWRAWGELSYSVRTGGCAFERVFGTDVFSYLADHPGPARSFDAAMTSRTGQEAAAVTAAYPWPSTGTIVDVGGGHGALLASILARCPGARGVLFDLPHVIAAARGGPADAAGLRTRCELVAGSFFESVPAGGDLYLLKRVIHDWDDERAVAILRNCRAAMHGAARLLVVDHVLSPGNEPSLGKWLDLQMLVLTPGGRERDEVRFRALLEAAGLRLERTLPAGPTASLVEAAAA